MRKYACGGTSATGRCIRACAVAAYKFVYILTALHLLTTLTCTHLISCIPTNQPYPPHHQAANIHAVQYIPATHRRDPAAHRLHIGSSPLTTLSMTDMHTYYLMPCIHLPCTCMSLPSIMQSQQPTHTSASNSMHVRSTLITSWQLNGGIRAA